MSQLLILLSLNALNASIFWVMWRGFLVAGETKVFWSVLVYQAAVTLLSVAFFVIRDSQFSHWGIRWSILPQHIDRSTFSNIACLVGSYGMACTNIVVAVVMYMFNGTIDVWVSGNAT